jgi:hypothetical protein
MSKRVGKWKMPCFGNGALHRGPPFCFLRVICQYKRRSRDKAHKKTENGTIHKTALPARPAIKPVTLLTTIPTAGTDIRMILANFIKSSLFLLLCF